jgi:hypothetical protein
MSRFSPKVPEAKKDPALSMGASKTEGGFVRTGSAVGPSKKSETKGDPGKFIGSVRSN